MNKSSDKKFICGLFVIAIIACICLIAGGALLYNAAPNSAEPNLHKDVASTETEIEVDIPNPSGDDESSSVPKVENETEADASDAFASDAIFKNAKDGNVLIDYSENNATNPQKPIYSGDQYTGVNVEVNHQTDKNTSDHTSSGTDKETNKDTNESKPTNKQDISDKIWDDNKTPNFNNFTSAEDLGVDDLVGTLDISSIRLSVNVYLSDADKMENETRGVAHFGNTSTWDGNVGVCGHNYTSSGDAAYFKNLHNVSIGDTITYKTSLGTRNYKITTKEEIAANDWSYLNRTDDNRITLITCNADGTKRIVVQATEI